MSIQAKFKVGQTIQWVLPHSHNTRRGKVVALVRPGESIRDLLVKKGHNPALVLVHAINMSSIAHRYLVDATLPGQRGTYYAPSLDFANKHGKVVA
jgi:hypothetical protein